MSIQIWVPRAAANWTCLTNSGSANEILEKYLAGIGGIEAIMTQTKAVKGKKRGRPSAAKKEIETSPPPATKRSRREAHPAASTPPAAVKKWMPPTGSWEDEVDTIDAQQDTGTGKLVVYLTWKNGQKTRHDTSVIYKKCPQMVCPMTDTLVLPLLANIDVCADAKVLRTTHTSGPRRGIGLGMGSRD